MSKHHDRIQWSHKHEAKLKIHGDPWGLNEPMQKQFDPESNPSTTHHATDTDVEFRANEYQEALKEFCPCDWYIDSTSGMLKNTVSA